MGKAWKDMTVKEKLSHYKSVRKWRLKNLDKARESSRKCYRKVRLEVLKYYGGNPPRCACCGESSIEFLTIDHIKGGGCQHRKEMSSLKILWFLRKNHPKGYRILCYNCNCSRGKWGYCPHEKMVKEL